MKILQKVELSTVIKGKRHPLCQFTIQEELEILEKMKGKTYRQAAEELQLSKSYLGKIAKIYKNLLKHH